MNIKQVKNDIMKATRLHMSGDVFQAASISLASIRNAGQCRSIERETVAMDAYLRCGSCCREMLASTDQRARSEAGRIKQEARFAIGTILVGVQDVP